MKIILTADMLTIETDTPLIHWEVIEAVIEVWRPARGGGNHE